MPVHVAILLKPYLDLILSGAKTVESRLTITARPPYRTIAPGDRIYFKASSGPFMAAAVADAVVFYGRLTPARIAALREEWNGRVRGEEPYWRRKRTSRYATFVTLRDVHATGVGPEIAPSRGPAWFTLNDDMAPKPIHATLTAGAVKNGYVPAPRGMTGGEPIQLLMPDGRTIETDIYRGVRIRWRGWHEYFKSHRLAPGDRVCFETNGVRNYRVSFACAAGHPPRPPGEGRGQGAPVLWDFITEAQLKALIREARAEDLGPQGRDATSELLIPADLESRAVFHARQAGRLAGAALLPLIVEAYDPRVKLAAFLHDGDRLAPGSRIAELAGGLRSILAIERVALNFLTHLSGVASLTARFVEGAAGTAAKVYDTRKTHPGLRGLEKYAVVCGGGCSHRMGLHDAVLVKDNHLAHLSLDELPAALAKMMEKARALSPPPAFVMIEVDKLEQLRRVLPLGPDVVLLDNMTPPTIRRAVTLRNRLAPRVKLEVSGGVRLASVARFARTGVDRISVGALTHSAPALDIGLDIE